MSVKELERLAPKEALVAVYFYEKGGERYRSRIEQHLEIFDNSKVSVEEIQKRYGSKHPGGHLMYGDDEHTAVVTYWRYDQCTNPLRSWGKCSGPSTRNGHFCSPLPLSMILARNSGINCPAASGGALNATLSGPLELLPTR